MLTAFIALVRKDLRIFFSDQRAVLISIAAPIAIASFMGYIFGGHREAESSRIPVLVSDRDESAISRGITAGLQADKALVVSLATPAEARDKVRKGSAAAAVVIPKNFGNRTARAFFYTAEKPEIEVLYDPSRSTERSMVEGILTGHVMEAVSKEMFTGQSGRETVDEALANLEQSTGLSADEKKSLRNLLESVRIWNARNVGLSSPGKAGPPEGLTVPYRAREEAVTSAAGVAYNGYAHSFGGMGIQFILFMGIDVGIAMLTQRQMGLWKRLRAAPLSRGVLLGSRAMSAAIISMLILTALFTFARLVFGVRIEGSAVGFAGVAIAFSLMTASFGLLIAALGRTPEAARGLSILVTLLMVMLGGAWVPTFVFPPWMQRITLIVPTRWAMDGMDAMTWRGLGLSAAVAPTAALLGCALVCGALAVARFRWEAGE